MLDPFVGMYSQFRSQYPTASLTSDLLVAEAGHYVVQAVVKIGGSALATGLSAAATVEVAEDQARARALMVLGISGTGVTPGVSMFDNSSRELPPSTPAQLNPARQPQAMQQPAAEPWNDEAWHWPHRDALDSLSAHAAFREEAIYADEPEIPKPAPPGLEDLPRPTQSRKKSAPAAPKRGHSQSRTSAPPEPIDLSDIIAQTDIELKRLGWTHAQGRRFLEQTYQKRSRQQLTDSELLEFLEYLKVQSVNQDPPF